MGERAVAVLFGAAIISVLIVGLAGASYAMVNSSVYALPADAATRVAHDVCIDVAAAAYDTNAAARLEASPGATYTVQETDPQGQPYSLGVVVDKAVNGYLVVHVTTPSGGVVNSACRIPAH